MLVETLQLMSLLQTPVLCPRVRLSALRTIMLVFLFTMKLLWLMLHGWEVCRGLLPWESRVPTPSNLVMFAGRTAVLVLL